MTEGEPDGLTCGTTAAAFRAEPLDDRCDGHSGPCGLCVHAPQQIVVSQNVGRAVGMHGPVEKIQFGEQDTGIKRRGENGVCVSDMGEIDGCDRPWRTSAALEAVPFSEGRRKHLA